MKHLKHPIYSQRNWVFVVGIIMVILLLVYPFDLIAGRFLMGILALNLLYGWWRNWLQHLYCLKWFSHMQGD
ncbi:MAG: hypothetical protein ACK5MJ_08845 [Alphaproteobacteria bacterium]